MTAAQYAEPFPGPADEGWAWAGDAKDDAEAYGLSHFVSSTIAGTLAAGDSSDGAGPAALRCAAGPPAAAASVGASATRAAAPAAAPRPAPPLP
jgi:hypothetical protein